MAYLENLRGLIHGGHVTLECVVLLVYWVLITAPVRLEYRHGDLDVAKGLQQGKLGLKLLPVTDHWRALHTAIFKRIDVDISLSGGIMLL